MSSFNPPTAPRSMQPDPNPTRPNQADPNDKERPPLPHRPRPSVGSTSGGLQHGGSQFGEQSAIVRGGNGPRSNAGGSASSSRPAKPKKHPWNTCRWNDCLQVFGPPQFGNPKEGMQAFKDHLVMHLTVFRGNSHPPRCCWAKCGIPISSHAMLVAHVSSHIGGAQIKIPMQFCRWQGCDFATSATPGSHNVHAELAAHAVSSHINRRTNADFASFSCEWDGCGNIFMSGRLLADHLSISHAGFSGMRICFCGSIVGKGKLRGHELSCPVFKNKDASFTSSPLSRKRSPSPTVTGESPRKLQDRKECPAPAVMIESDSEAPEDEEAEGEKEPSAKKLPQNPILRNLELTRLDAARREAEQKQKYTRMRDQKRLERIKARMQEDENKPAAGNKNGTPKPEPEPEPVLEPNLQPVTEPEPAVPLPDAASNLSNPVEPVDPEFDPEVDPNTHPPTADPDPVDPQAPLRVSAFENHPDHPSIVRVYAFAQSLCRLANGLIEAVDNLPEGPLLEFADRVQNDWAVDRMTDWVYGVLAENGRESYMRWVRVGENGGWNESGVDRVEQEEGVEVDGNGKQ
ncbi:hypothetical protein FN846DRAFT_933645 [Sphaerosporella brunnea]|uniref:C2H2-type domain-containing protein n=1 Tax=Sphaerosporella brunnea TaxID=1250544 RepID=A0A5J5F724_9PEZI|nr:hypothetical protein FN846DRAFT_933645 [Sphaerosporella brunnea]